MKILITGSEGFVGRNLTESLKNNGYEDILAFDVGTDRSRLIDYAGQCDFVFHLAGVNRPETEEDFIKGNRDLTLYLTEALKKNKNTSPVLFTSSIQAECSNPYGKSKKAGEDILFGYGREAGAEIYCYRLYNLFGKWSRPNYNSVVATFCHNIARDLDIRVNDPMSPLTLCYIDDVIDEFMRALMGKPTKEGIYCNVPVKHTVSLGELASRIRGFRDSRERLYVPDMKDDLTKKLYSTYISFLPEDKLSYELDEKKDSRGSFTEFIRSEGAGQVSVNITVPGVTKGNHWHMTKNEKFLVISGSGLIRLRKLNTDHITEYEVSGNKPEVVDIPPGYTHSIKNTGITDLITVMWANEVFDPARSDTFYLEV